MITLVVLALALVLMLAIPKVGPATKVPTMKKKRIRKENPMLLGLRWVPTSVTAPLWLKPLPTSQQLVVARARKREAS
ncbi:MAG: hypothetical protein H0V17_18125 [Deltaproteobacteria bacterium]|nr:hypothetical protein [Deltaproteobacteria bacterium]